MNARGIFPIFWPHNSPDLNSIEKFWWEIKKRLSERVPLVTRKWNLYYAVMEEWNKISESFINDLLKDMQKRCDAVILAKESPIDF
jgi:hypothetical protein